MKKYLMILLIIFCLTLTSCADYSEGDYVDISTNIESSDFDLVVDSKTKIVYIDNIVKESDATLQTYHIYTPYYSKNGKLCRYEDGKLMEVEND